jgi:hypothetical protein
VKPDWFWHIKLNTADCRQSHRREVGEESIAAMREMELLKPEAKLPFPGYRIKTTTDRGGAVFTVFKKELALVHCLLAMTPDDSQYWEMV